MLLLCACVALVCALAHAQEGDFTLTDFSITSTDPNVHSLYIPSAAYGKVMGFNYGNVSDTSY
jgi:hypothetical protein